MTEENYDKPNYILLFGVPLVGDIESLIIDDQEVPFQVLKTKNDGRNFLMVASNNTETPDFDVVARAWLKFKIAINAYEYDDFVKSFEDEEHIPTNLYGKHYREEEIKEE